MADGSERELRRLEAAIQADPGAPEFPALAEMYRRAGRLAEAEGVVRRGLERRPEANDGRVVLGLTLLNQGRYDAALATFEEASAAVVAAAGVRVDDESSSLGASGPTDAELERAFESAEPDAEALIDPDRVAEEAVERVDAPAARPMEEHPLSDEIRTGGTFATRTMAELLERQGDQRGAAQIRAGLGGSKDAAGAAGVLEDRGTAWRQRTITVLQSWLQNLRGEAT